MPIRFRCPSCKQVLSVSSRKAGQKVQCPACQSPLRVPTPKPSQPSSASDTEPQSTPSSPPPPETTKSTPPPTPAAAPTPAASTREPVFEQASEDVFESESVKSDSVDDEVLTDAVLGGDGTVDESVNESLESSAAPSGLAGGWPELIPEPEGDEEEFALRRAQTEFEDMDLTPMVDVTFLLLIFFMITASFTMQKAIAFPPPSPDEEGASVQPKQIDEFKDESIIVEIHEDNSISIDDERIPLDTDADNLASMLAAKGKTELLIDAHENCMHETVVKVVDAGNAVQMQKIRLGSRGGR